MKNTFKIIAILYFLGLFSMSSKDISDCSVFIEQLDALESVEEKLVRSLILLDQIEDISCKFQLWEKRADIFEKTSQVDSTSHSLKKASEIAEIMGDDERYLETTLKNTFFYISANKKDQVIQTLNNCRKKLNQNPKSKHWVTYYNRYAYYKDGERDYESAIKYIDSGIQLGEKFNYEELVHKAYLEKAGYHIRLSQYQDAVKAIQNGISIIERQDSQKELGFAYFLKGICYERLRDFEKAKEALEASIAVASRYNDLKRLARSYSRLSISLGHLKENDKALEVLDSTITISKRINDHSTEALGYSDKGFILIHNIEDYEAAEKAFLKSNDIFATKKVSQRTKDITYMTNLGGLVMLSEKKKDYSKMLTYLKQYETKVNELDLLIQKKTLALFYVEYNEGIGNYKKALEYHKEVTKIADSITNKEVRIDVADLERKYETQKKEIEILKLSEESQKQKIKTQQAETKQHIFSAVALFAVFLLLGGFWAFIKTRKQKKTLNITHEKLKESHEKVASINSVKDRLFSIISHDMRNMLIPFQRSGKILKYHIEKGNYDKVIELSGKLQENSLNLSHMLDNLLNWSLEQMNGYSFKQEGVNIFDELTEIKQAFISYADEKNTIINISGEPEMKTIFDKGAFHIIFRNIIGNALKYTEEGIITISFFEKDNMLQYQISDTGIGMSQKQLDQLFKLQKNKTAGTGGEKGTGIGLNLVYRFVGMCHGEINVSSEMRIGTQFELSFPKRMINEKLNTMNTEQVSS